ncbi:MAG: WD40 repeat domain-containing protein [Candidatus Hodarchaeales archaeon]
MTKYQTKQILFSICLLIALSTFFFNEPSEMVERKINSTPSESSSFLNNRIFPSIRINSTDTLIWNLSAHTSEVWSVAFNPKENMLASASSDNFIFLWDIETGQMIRNLTGHADSVFSLAFHPGGDILASGSFDQNVFLWNITTGEVIANLTGHTSAVWSVAFNSEGNLLSSGSNDNLVKLWNVTDIGTSRLLFNLTGHSARIRTVTFSPNSQILASGSDDNSIKLWNVSSDAINIEKNAPLIKNLINHSDNVGTVAFSPDSEKLVSGSNDQLINLWDIETGEVITTYTGHEGWVRAIAFSPDGHTIVSGGIDNEIKFWDTIHGDLLGNLTSHTGSILSLEFDATGQLLASSSSDRNVKLWNVTDIDSDEIPNWWERLYDLDPGNSDDSSEDPDNDNLVNLYEYKFGTSPIMNDTDMDNIPDGYEFNHLLNGTSDDAGEDLDGDGIPNLYEYQNGLFVGTNDATDDTDGDGLPNLIEYQNGLLAGTDDDAADDVDNDGMPNLYEYQNNLLIAVDDAANDLDNDGLTNLEEYLLGTNPRIADTDKDGWNDGSERNWGTDAQNASSNPVTLIGLLILIVSIIGSSSFIIIRYRSQIQSILVSLGQTITGQTDSWVSDLEKGKAIPVEMLTKNLEKTELELPKIVKNQLTDQQLAGKTLVMRSQMLMLQPVPPQNANCQTCMSEIEDTNYFQCMKCRRYICVNDYVDLQEVGRENCPNCSGDLLIFPFTCSACGLDYSSIKELSSQSRCPLCGYSLPDQSELRSELTKGLQPSIISQTQQEEDFDVKKNHKSEGKGSK